MPTLSLAIDSRGAVAGAQSFNISARSVTLNASAADLANRRLGRGLNLVGVAGGATAAILGVTLFNASRKQALEMIRVAAAAEEVRSKFQAVFKGEAPEAERRLLAIASSAGRAKIDLLDMAAGIQDILVPLGLSREAAAQLSTGLSQLAVDVGSFQNRSASEVGERFQSALVGNTEAVRSLGINLSAAAVQDEAFRLGLASTKAELTEQDKVLARVSLLYRNTADAQGDAERTADSYENTMKRLSGTLKDTRAEIGLGLTQDIRTAITETIGLDRAQTGLRLTLEKVGSAASSAVGFLGRLTAGALDLTGADFQLEALDDRLYRAIDAGQITEEEARRTRRRAQAASDAVPRLLGSRDRRRVERGLEPTGNGLPDVEKQIAAIEKVASEFETSINNRSLREASNQLLEIGVSLKEIEAVNAANVRELMDAFRVEFDAIAAKESEEHLKRVLELQSRLEDRSAVRANPVSRDYSFTPRDAAEGFAAQNRTLVTGVESGLGNFSSAIGAAAAGFTSLKDAGRSALQGLIFDLARATSEALLFKGVIEPLLGTAGVGGSSYAGLLGQSLGLASSGLGNSSRQGGGFNPVGASYPAPVNSYR